jgi:hypothetical protein
MFSLIVIAIAIPVLLIVLVFQIVFRIVAGPLKLGFGLMRFRSQRQHPLTDNERMLRRASHPVGVAAVAYVVMQLFHLRAPYDAIAAFGANPAAYWLPALLVASLVLYGLSVFVTGLRRCADLRDGTTSRAVLFAVAGVGVAVYLARLNPSQLPGPPQVVAVLLPSLLLVAVWFGSIGASRFVLVRSGSIAQSIAAKRMRAGQFEWRNARRHWWQFWKRRQP